MALPGSPHSSILSTAGGLHRQLDAIDLQNRGLESFFFQEVFPNSTNFLLTRYRVRLLTLHERMCAR